MIPLNNRKVSSRELRRQLNHESALLERELVPAVQSLLNNDRVSQAKITALETWRRTLEARTFWQRLRDLVRGV